MRPLVVLFVFAILSGVAVGQDLGMKVTVTCPGASLRGVLADLTKQTGVPLHAMAAPGDSIVALRVQKLPLKEVLDRLATVTASQWERDEKDGLRLVSSAAAQRQNASDVIALRTKELEDAIQKLAKRAKIQGAWTAKDAVDLAEETEIVMNPPSHSLSSDSKDVIALMNRSPESRSIVRVLLALNPAELAKSIVRGRAVFGANPTKMQLSLPSGSFNSLNQFMQEQTLFVDATKAYLARHPGNLSAFGMPGVGRGQWGGGDPSLGLGQAILKIYWNDVSAVGYANLVIADRSGGVLCDSTADLEGQAPEPKVFPALENEKPLVPNELATQLLEANKVVGDQNGSRSYAVQTTKGMKRIDIAEAHVQRNVPISSKLKEALLQPEAIEPQSLGAGGALIQIAERRDLNLVANLEDDGYTTCMEMLPKVTSGGFLSSAALQNYHRVEIEDGWLVVQPKNLALCAQDRVSRAGLGRLLGSVSKNKLLLLSDIAAFSLSQQAVMGRGGIDFEYLRAINPGASDRGYSPFLWQTYRLFGSLTSAQKNAIVNGDSVSFRNLTPGATDAVAQIAFRGNNQPELMGEDGADMNSKSQSIFNDWTQLLPNGVPGDGFLTAKVTQQPGAYCLNAGVDSAEIVPANTMASERYVLESQKLGVPSAAMTYDRFLPATVWTYSFRLHFTPQVATDKALTDGTYDANLAPVTFDQLPASFRDAMNKELAELREAFGKVDFGNDFRPAQGGTTPPR